MLTTPEHGPSFEVNEPSWGGFSEPRELMVMRDVEEPPDTRRLYAPMLAAGRTVNARAGGAVRLALFRDRHGEACAVGFTSAEALERVLGTTKYEAWPLGRACLRELADARGVRRLLVDPVFAAATVSNGELGSATVAEPASAGTSAAARATSSTSSRRVDPQVVGALAVCAVAGVAAVFLGELR
jgi:hypothetical protein